MDEKLKAKNYRSIVEGAADIKPYFLTNTPLDVMSFETAKSIFTSIAKLFVNKVLTDRQIDGIINEVNLVFDSIIEISAPVTLFYFNYIEEQLIHIKRALINDELYEIVSNLDRFLKKFQKI